MQLRKGLGLLLLDLRDNVVSQRTIHAFEQFVISKRFVDVSVLDLHPRNTFGLALL